VSAAHWATAAHDEQGRCSRPKGAGARGRAGRIRYPRPSLTTLTVRLHCTPSTPVVPTNKKRHVPRFLGSRVFSSKRQC